MGIKQNGLGHPRSFFYSLLYLYGVIEVEVEFK